MVESLIGQFSKLCIQYPDMPIQSVFNRYMQVIKPEEIELLKPYFMLMVKTGEEARKADPIIKQMILNN